MRKLVKDFLVRQNFEVLEAEDGEKAIDLFYEDKRYRAHYPGCYDAEDGWLGGLQGDPQKF